MPEIPQQFMPFLWILVIFAVFWFILIRPEQKKRKTRQEMLDSLQTGDKVVSIGGIIGTITELREETIRLRVDDKVELTMNREAVGYPVKEGQAD